MRLMTRDRRLATPDSHSRQPVSMIILAESAAGPSLPRGMTTSDNADSVRRIRLIDRNSLASRLLNLPALTILEAGMKDVSDDISQIPSPSRLQKRSDQIQVRSLEFENTGN